MSPTQTIRQKTGQSQTPSPPPAQERLERDQRHAQRAAEALHQPWRSWGCPQPWWWRSQGAYTVNKSFLAKSSG